MFAFSVWTGGGGLRLIDTEAAMHFVCFYLNISNLVTFPGDPCVSDKFTASSNENAEKLEKNFWQAHRFKTFHLHCKNLIFTVTELKFIT